MRKDVKSNFYNYQIVTSLLIYICEVIKVDVVVDVLVTFYNQENYVDRTLQSIIKQKCNFLYRIIIGDDGSSDSTINKIRKWKEKYPDIISYEIMPRNQNEKYIGGFRASQNRLNLLKKVRAEYFIFLDGDDYFSDQNKLQKEIDILNYEVNQDCIACAHRIKAVNESGKTYYYPTQNLKAGKYSVEKYWSDLYFHTDTLVIRSSVISKIDFNLVNNHFNDNMITYLVFQYGKIYYLPEIMAVYCLTGDGIWTGGKQLVNYIRNIMLYDLCVKINSGLERQSGNRFLASWVGVFKTRKVISRNFLNQIKEEADRNNLKFSQMWLRYDLLNFRKKIQLYYKLMTIVCRGYLNRLVRKMGLKVYD